MISPDDRTTGAVEKMEVIEKKEEPSKATGPVVRSSAQNVRLPPSPSHTRIENGCATRRSGLRFFAG
jgi:hypothetical protein